MSTVVAAAAVLALLAWCWVVGHGLLRLARAGAEAPETRHALALVAGLLLGHLLLLLADLAGVPWTRATLLGGGAFALLALAVPLRAAWRERASAKALRWDWADVLALAALAAFAISSLALRSPFTDFVYHWGLKGHRFFLARGIDAGFLARPENEYLHPDYPNLLPDSYAAASLLAGRFDPRALMLFTPLFVLALLAVVRAALSSPAGRSALEPFARRAIFAGLACALAAFCIGYLQAGSADPPFALAVALAADALLVRAGRASAIQLGLAAAFACAVKIEGVPFAALAIGAFVLRAVLHDRAALRAPALWLALLAPTVLVTVPWALQVRALALFQDTNTGSLDLASAGEVLAPLWRQTFVEEWLGLPLLLAALPWLAWTRATRWLGLLLLAQLGFYLFVYLSAPFDPTFYVLSTWPRLALHLLPATVVGVALALAGDSLETDAPSA
ncbi:MAG TPA: hypothetical protein VMV46_15145 [Thermoanaerobaculia bacterium]|nr:hypothetical protein [Thermoanaerobaculia bacterium]